MYCRNCGAEVRPGTKFCPTCGVALKPPSATTAPAPAPAPKPTSPAPAPAPASAPTAPVSAPAAPAPSTAPQAQPAPSPEVGEPALAPAPATVPVDAKAAKRAARHRVLGGFPLFLVCLGFVQSIYLFASGVVLVVYALSMQPLYANEWMRYVIYGAAGGYGLAGLSQLISAVLLSRRGKRFLVLYVISAIFDVLTLVALLVVFVMGGLMIWPTIASIAVVVVVLVLVLVYCAKSSRLRTFLSAEDLVPTMPPSSDGR